MCLFTINNHHHHQYPPPQTSRCGYSQEKSQKDLLNHCLHNCQLTFPPLWLKLPPPNTVAGSLHISMQGGGKNEPEEDEK